MTEAWLLIDEGAIRRAADNPSGTAALDLPEIDRLEEVPDPKEILHRSLLAASEKRGRRRDSFRRSLARRVYRVADLIPGYADLRRLAAFRAFEERAGQVLARLRTEMEGIQ